MDIFKLFGTIAVNNSEANKAIDDTAKASRKIGDGFKDSRKTTGKSLKEIAAENGKTVGEIRSEAMKLAAEYKRQGMSASEATKKAYADMGYAAKSTHKEINEEIDDTVEEMGGLSDSLAEVSEQTEKTSGGFTIMKGILADLAATAVKKMISAGSGLVKSIIDIGAEFDSQMSTVASISGATAEEFETLRAKAQEMGATTAFSATESAQALEYMAMAGWSTSEMADGLAGVMNLAAASGEDLAATSDIVTDAMTAFGMSADQSTYFSDVLAKTASSANTNVGLMGETFKYIAPLAGAMNYSIEDMSVAIGLMANAGIKGSQSGTSLRNIITNLASPTDTVVTAMEALGISLVDSDGKTKTFNTTLSEMRESFADLDEVQRTQYASAIAGKEGMSGFLALINSSDSDFEALTKSIENCAGASEEMAKIRLDNLEGDVTLFKSAVEGAKIAVSDKLSPVLRDIVQKATEAIPKIQKKLNAVVDIVMDIGSYLIKNFGPILKDFGKVLLPLIKSALKTIKPLIEEIGAVLKPILKFVEPIFEIAVKGLGKIIELLPELGLKSILENLGFIKDEAGGVSEKYQKIAESANKMADDLKLIKEENAKIGEEVLAEYGHYKDLAGELDNLVDKNGKIKEHYEYRVKQIVEELNPVMGDTLKIVDGELQGYKDIAAEIDNIILKKEAETLIDKGRENYDSAVEKRGEAMREKWDHEDEKSELEKQLRELNKEDYLDLNTGGLPKYYEKKNQLLTDIESLNNTLEKDKENIMGLTNEIENYENLRNSATENNISAMKRYTTAYSSNLITCNNGTLSALKKQSEEQSAIYEKMLEDRKKGDKSITDSMLSNAQSRSNIAKDEYLKAKQLADEQGKAAAESFAAGADSMLNTVKVSGGKITSSYAEGVTSESETAKNAVYEMLSEASNSNDEFTRNTAKQLGEMFSQGFADGIEEAAFLAVAGAAQMASSAMAAVQHTIDSHSPSRKTAQFGRFFTDGFAIGITENIDSAVESAKTMADSTLNSLRNNMDSDVGFTLASRSDISEAGIKAQSRGTAEKTESVHVNNNSDILSKLTELIEVIKKQKIYLDGRALVGGIADEIDSALGMRSRLKRRGI